MAEEKIKKLKKRNTELVSIARQLEEKAKKLQEEKATAQVCTLGDSYILCNYSYSWISSFPKIVTVFCLECAVTCLLSIMNFINTTS